MSWMAEEEIRGGFPDPALLGLSGLERMRAGLQGLMPPPPMHHLFGLRPVSAGPAMVTFSMPASPWLQSSAGVFLAGTAALVADAPLGSAVLVTQPPGKVAVTSDLTLNFLRPMSVTSEHLTARARPVDVGSRLGLAEAIIEDAHGRVLAHSTTRCFLVDMGVPDAPAEPEPVPPRVYDSPDPYQRPLTASPLPKDVLEGMTWLEISREQAAGRLPLPPFVELFGMLDAEASEGLFASTMPATPWLCSPAGTIYGGILAFFADSNLTAAVSMALARNQICSPLDLKVSYLRPAFPDGRPLRADARVVHRGRSFAVAECEITNAEGKKVALASSSSVIIDAPPWTTFVAADETPASL